MTEHKLLRELDHCAEYCTSNKKQFIQGIMIGNYD